MPDLNDCYIADYNSADGPRRVVVRREPAGWAVEIWDFDGNFPDGRHKLWRDGSLHNSKEEAQQKALNALQQNYPADPIALSWVPTF